MLFYRNDSVAFTTGFELASFYWCDIILEHYIQWPCLYITSRCSIKTAEPLSWMDKKVAAKNTCLGCNFFTYVFEH